MESVRELLWTVRSFLWCSVGFKSGLRLRRSRTVIWLVMHPPYPLNSARQKHLKQTRSHSSLLLTVAWNAASLHEALWSFIRAIECCCSWSHTWLRLFLLGYSVWLDGQQGSWWLQTPIAFDEATLINDNSPKVKPKHVGIIELGRSEVYIHPVSTMWLKRRGTGQITFPPKMASVILAQFGWFVIWCYEKKQGETSWLTAEIDSRLVKRVDRRDLDNRSLLRRVWFPMTSPARDGSAESYPGSFGFVFVRWEEELRRPSW